MAAHHRQALWGWLFTLRVHAVLCRMSVCACAALRVAVKLNASQLLPQGSAVATERSYRFLPLSYLSSSLAAEASMQHPCSGGRGPVPRESPEQFLSGPHISTSDCQEPPAFYSVSVEAGPPVPQRA